MSVNGMRDKLLFCSILSKPDPIFQPSITQQKINMVKSVSGNERIKKHQIQEAYQKANISP